MILQVNDWDIILILGLEMLNCRTKGLEMSQFTRCLLNVTVYVCVKDLTNIMSVAQCAYQARYLGV